MGAAEADRTLFVGNLDPRATEEILFELFLQAGPATNVKIPKDKDGKSKQFAFVNFKHEESVPYGMSLLNGIKLFGRPLKIQFRSGSSHGSGDANSAAYSSQGNGSFAVNSPAAHDRRHDGNGEYVKYSEHSPAVPVYQRSYSSLDSLQRQAMMNNFYRSETPHGSSPAMMAQPSFSPSNYTPTQSRYSGSEHSPPHRYDSSSSHRNRSHGSHPYQKESYHSNRDAHYRGGQEEHYYHDNEGQSPNHRREPRWHSSRH
ncbi:RNA-binding protein 7 [Pseudophryne corroboree]|uniref:RNA-binding protein 7 n=1 Tax=Pseudophryne corroboree TaxID=495146 RepID=UPI003081D3C0